MENFPEKPKEEDCCGSGCNPCIFDVYENKLKQFKLGDLKNGSSAFNDIKYTPFLVYNVTMITSDTNLYTFQPIKLCNEQQIIHFKMGDYIIHKATFTDDNGHDESISRSFTPIINECLDKGLFQVIIRLYKNGKMSRIVRNYKIGDITHWRGPYNHLKLKTTKNVILLGAGTGIVPLFNIAKELVDDESCESRISLIGCFNAISSILLRDEIQSLNNFWNFDSEFYIAQDSVESVRYNEKINVGKLDLELFRKKLLEYNVCDLFLVICGPELFSETFKDVSITFGLRECDNLQVL